MKKEIPIGTVGTLRVDNKISTIYLGCSAGKHFAVLMEGNNVYKEASYGWPYRNLDSYTKNYITDMCDILKIMATPERLAIATNSEAMDGFILWDPFSLLINELMQEL